jgi:hypothetical protein
VFVRWPSNEQQAWIVNFRGGRARKGAQIVAAGGDGQGNVMIWTYPGGTFIYEITTGVYYPYGVTDSLPPH